MLPHRVARVCSCLASLSQNNSQIPGASTMKPFMLRLESGNGNWVPFHDKFNGFVLLFPLFFFETENQNARAHFLEHRFWDRIQPPSHMAAAWWERSGSNTSFKSGLPHWRLPFLVCVYVCLLVCLPPSAWTVQKSPIRNALSAWLCQAIALWAQEPLPK